MAFAEDLSVFLSVDEFATPATLDGAAVCGIFDRAYQLAAVGDVGMASTRPVFTMPTASVPANVEGKAFVHAGVNYKVAAHEPDGTGITLLILELAA